MHGPATTAAIKSVRAIAPSDLARPDVVAWLLLALRATGTDGNCIQACAERLHRFQSADGRVAVDPDQPSTYWPTAIAAFAWNGLAGEQGRAESAVRFLSDSTGKHWPRPDGSIGHDTAIVGWSWVDATHSWVVPSAMAMLALTRVGTPAAVATAAKLRVRSGVHLLLDRQLPDGGWNYGNTVVLGNTLKPLPEETAWALAALAGHAEQQKVDRSLRYLEGQKPLLLAPVTLAAAILAWSAWGDCDRLALCERSLAMQDKTGPYPLAMVAQLLAVTLQPSLILSRGRSEARDG